MALSDNQKLVIAKRVLVEAIMAIETWDDFKAFISTVTKLKIKNKLQAIFQKRDEDDQEVQAELDSL